MEVIEVEGATGNIHTNFEGKAQAAIDALARGNDLVYVHVEAPDECGHRAETENKVKSIEYLDSRIIAPIEDALKASGEAYRFLILPDHPTPIAMRTHSIDAVPYILYTSNAEVTSDAKAYDECFGVEDVSYLDTVNYAKGERMMDVFLK